ncbi:MAG: hypothetical protein KC420_11210, partial [Myxococcales bacterium]|nr:hypothetical protein [Myxococcales bacterium]
STTTKASAKKASAKKSTAKNATAKKGAAKKSAAKKSAAKKSAAKKSAAKKSGAVKKSSAAKKGPAPAGQIRLDSTHTWPSRPWPALPVQRQDAEAAARYERRPTSALTIRGELTYDDAETLQAAVAAFDDNAYIEFYSSADLKIDGRRLTVDLDGELEADCTGFDEGFVALTRPARSGAVVVHAGFGVGARRYVAGAYGYRAELPALPPGAIARSGAPLGDDERGDDRRVWSFADRTWLFDQGFRGSKLEVRAPDGEVLAIRSFRRAAVDVAAGGGAAILISEEGLEIVGPDLEARLRWPLDRDLGRLAITADGRLMMLIDEYSERLRVFDVASGEARWSARGYFRDAGDFVGGDRLALAGALEDEDGDPDAGEGLLLFDAASGAVIARRPVDDLRSIAPDPGGETFHVVARGRIEVFAAADGAPISSLELVEGGAEELEAAAGEWRCREGGERWDRASGLPLHDHVAAIQSLALAGDRIISRDHQLLIVRRLDGAVLLRGLVGGESRVAIDPTGAHLVLVEDGALVHLDVEGGAWSRSRKIGATAVAFTPDGRLLSGHKDGSIRVWASPAGGAFEAHQVGPRPIEALHVGPDGALALAISPEGRGARARLFDLATFKVRCSVACGRWSRAGAVTAAGTFVVADEQGTALHDAEGRELARLSGAPTQAAAADLERLVVGIGRFLFLVDPASGARLGVLEGHEDTVCAVALAPGRIVSADRQILVWDQGAIAALGGTHPIDEELSPLP